MEDTLRQLSEFQIEALRKGISFDIDLYINDKQVPMATVRMTYTVTGGISKGYTFNTTFGGNTCQSKKDDRLASISYFLSTVTGPNDNNQ